MELKWFIIIYCCLLLNPAEGWRGRGSSSGRTRTASSGYRRPAVVARHPVKAAYQPVRSSPKYVQPVASAPPLSAFSNSVQPQRNKNFGPFIPSAPALPRNRLAHPGQRGNIPKPPPPPPATARRTNIPSAPAQPAIVPVVLPIQTVRHMRRNNTAENRNSTKSRNSRNNGFNNGKFNSTATRWPTPVNVTKHGRSNTESIIRPYASAKTLTAPNNRNFTTKFNGTRFPSPINGNKRNYTTFPNGTIKYNQFGPGFPLNNTKFNVSRSAAPGAMPNGNNSTIVPKIQQSVKAVPWINIPQATPFGAMPTNYVPMNPATPSPFAPLPVNNNAMNNPPQASPFAPLPPNNYPMNNAPQQTPNYTPWSAPLIPPQAPPNFNAQPWNGGVLPNNGQQNFNAPANPANGAEPPKKGNGVFKSIVSKAIKGVKAHFNKPNGGQAPIQPTSHFGLKSGLNGQSWDNKRNDYAWRSTHAPPSSPTKMLKNHIIVITVAISVILIAVGLTVFFCNRN